MWKTEYRNIIDKLPYRYLLNIYYIHILTECGRLNAKYVIFPSKTVKY